MTPPPDKRLLWHPRRDNKFIVGGTSQITLYEWASDYPEIRRITSQHDLHYMKCFAWSPDPLYDDLIAVGTGTGKVDLIRLESTKYNRQHNVLPSGHTVSLPVLKSRACNALAFSTGNSNYLAVGLEKVRGESSLVIWDVNAPTPLLSVPPSSSSHAHIDTHVSLPPKPVIPRAEVGPRVDGHILQQHAPTEAVNALAFLPESTHLLFAGLSHRWLRLFDLRSLAPATVNVAAKVQGIATDPFDHHRIATFSEGVVTVWDQRRLSTPLLTFTERDAVADGAILRFTAQHTPVPYSTIEFSSTRRGTLATHQRDDVYIRFWDLTGAQTVESPPSDSETKSQTGGSIAPTAGRTKKSWAGLPWTTGGVLTSQPQPDQSPKETENYSSVILSETRRTKYFQRPLISFALVPNTQQTQSITSNVMVINNKGDLELYAVHDTPKQVLWNARGDLTYGAGRTMRVLDGYSLDDEDELGRDPWDIATTDGIKHSVERDKENLDGRKESRDRDYHEEQRQQQHHSGEGPAVDRGRTRASEPNIPSHRRQHKSNPAPLFGRGDEDGFPALGVTPAIPTSSSGLGRHGRHQPHEHHHAYSPSSGRAGKADSHARSGSGTIGRYDALSRDTERRKKSPLSRTRSGSRGMRGHVKGIWSVVEDDISMTMRRRTILGYGLSKPENNVFITQNPDDPSDTASQTLSEIWDWIWHSQDLLCTPTSRIHGYDFAFQGLIGIWEGFSPISNSPPTQSHHHTHRNSIESTQSQSSYQTSNSNLLDPHTIPSIQEQHPGPPRRHNSHHNSNSNNSNRRSTSPFQGDSLHGNFYAALNALASRNGMDKAPWKPGVATSRPLQRQVALWICGWGFREEDMNRAIDRWKKEGQHSRAACWLVFTRRYGEAVKLLMQSNDEAHKMMSGTVAALIPHGSGSKSTELREHCERLIVWLQDPYFRAMLTHLALGEWSEVLEEDMLPFRERLAIAFQFLDDKSLTSYLRRVTDRACSGGDIEGLLVTGLTKSGVDILQSYIDRTGDIQTGAILGSYVCPVKFLDGRVERWLEAYRDLLDGFKLHHHRVGFDIERGQRIQDAVLQQQSAGGEWVPRQILLKCGFCSKPVNSGTALAKQKGQATACPHCNRALPRCSICLLTLSIVQDGPREVELMNSQHRDPYDDAIVICQSCRHGGHATHILQWFFGDEGARSHGVCPVADCDCRCADEF
ncbi:hypothetical protein BDN72DRAFT_813031 [Pluteus cervinus]|uniref:Uncharacterized protein n=1 Tax=Pluteus cervinus TaxID=181527 RepID=A0ACD3B9F7_9AGAR|nr:hypothetical protein BDN72DRAFT_813031 [Pluteus cervinus]